MNQILKHPYTSFIGPTLIFLSGFLFMAHAQGTPELPVKVYVMVGQSNMQGYGHVGGAKPNTLETLVKNDSAGKYSHLTNADGSWREREDVWIHLDMGAGNEKFGGLRPNYGARDGFIGPELAFGHKMGDSYDGKVLIIKTSWGGKSLGNDFLPPSKGEYPKPGKPGNTGFYYHEILRLTKQVTENIKTYFPDYQGQGIEFAGLCFHQGWNDQYGGLDAFYEANLRAFIDDIRSVEHGIGVPNLPVVIATSGMLSDQTSSLIVQGQLAMADAGKYPELVGNVAVVSTSEPYGPEKLPFLFPASESPRNQGFHWNGNARTHLSIGTAMAQEMSKLTQPKRPSRLAAHGTPEGVRLTWQIGSVKPTAIKLMANGEELEARLPITQTTYTDRTALPGTNNFEILFALPNSEIHKLSAQSDTSIERLIAYKTTEGIVLNWTAKGRYAGFKIARDNQVLSTNIPLEARTYTDTNPPENGVLTYYVAPQNGNSTIARTTLSMGQPNPGQALIYEPFDYPYDPKAKQGVRTSPSLFGQGGAKGTTGVFKSVKENERWLPLIQPGGMTYGDLPTNGNKLAGHKWSGGAYVELDNSLSRARLLSDGGTMWISCIVYTGKSGASISLRSADMNTGIGLRMDGREHQTIIIKDGEQIKRRIGGVTPKKEVFLVAKLTWGKDGEDDSFLPYWVPPELTLPEGNARPAYPYQIDQTQISRLVVEGSEDSYIDEIRVGPTFESVIGAK
jgi:alpha-galactosidase